VNSYTSDTEALREISQWSTKSYLRAIGRLRQNLQECTTECVFSLILVKLDVIYVQCVGIDYRSVIVGIA